MIRKLYRGVKKTLKKISFSFKKKVPVFIPVLQGDLLKDRVALITGGTRGIGYEIARSFLQNGATVVVTGRSSESVSIACTQLKENCTEKNRVYGIELNSLDVGSFKKKIDEIIVMLGDKRIDILVNNAGINTGASFGNTSEKDFDNVLNSNLRGTYILSQVIATYMKNNKIRGNILNIASSSSLRPGNSPYTLSKWGVRGLTLGLAKALISYGIVVNGLAPGPTNTSMLIKNDYEGIELVTNPSGRYATSEEIANMAVVLVSSLCKLVVGDIVYMTGGAGLLTYDDVDYNF